MIVCIIAEQAWSLPEIVTYVLRSRAVKSEVGSIDCEISPEKGMYFFCFLLFWEPFNCYNFGTIGPIHLGFLAKCKSPNEHFNQIENMKMSHVRLEFPRSYHILFIVTLAADPYPTLQVFFGYSGFRPISLSHLLFFSLLCCSCINCTLQQHLEILLLDISCIL